MILEIEDKNGEIYVCKVRECDEDGNYVFKDNIHTFTEVSLADVTFDEYFDTNELMFRLKLEW